jgi:hypothetical protein
LLSAITVGRQPELVAYLINILVCQH